jgi:hypothetical protein
VKLRAVRYRWVLPALLALVTVLVATVFVWQRHEEERFFMSVYRGMPEAEVVENLGPPLERVSAPFDEELQPCSAAARSVLTFRRGDLTQYVFLGKEGKVECNSFVSLRRTGI